MMKFPTEWKSKIHVPVTTNQMRIGSYFSVVVYRKLLGSAVIVHYIDIRGEKVKDTEIHICSVFYFI